MKPEDYSPGYRQYQAAKRRGWALLILSLISLAISLVNLLLIHAK